MLQVYALLMTTRVQYFKSSLASTKLHQGLFSFGDAEVIAAAVDSGEANIMNEITSIII